ncbi:MAG: Holliday junction resolvase RuvX [Phycisphaerales bacterium]|nr:MAG: Holliday junction resolvase RuvX [Phycisphaerales bacterium]
MTRYLGIDYGSKRIGLAISDPNTGIASPLSTIEVTGGLRQHVDAVAQFLAEYEVDALVVGLPLNMDGIEGGQAKVTMAFGDELSQVTSLPIHYHDERLSSRSAVELLLPAELTRKKKKARLDSVAAQVMLQDFLNAQTEG